MNSKALTELEVGLPGDTWRVSIETNKLVLKSQLIRAMLLGSLVPAHKVSPPTFKLPYMEKNAFNHFLRYLQDEPINFTSVVTARDTLDVAYQFICPQLALMAVTFLEKNLNSSNVLKVYHGLLSYTNDSTYNALRQQTTLEAPLRIENDDSIIEIVAACQRLIHSCLIIIDSEVEAILSQRSFEELFVEELSSITSRNSLHLQKESVLFSALDRWAASECKRQNIESSSVNKRAVLIDDVWFNVRYLLMSEEEFIQGPMSSGILSSEETAHIISRILGHDKSQQKVIEYAGGALLKLNNVPRINRKMQEDSPIPSTKSEENEQKENRKNRRKECVIQGQRACARIGNCLVRILACVFD